jgi:hypothetical protein
MCSAASKKKIWILQILILSTLAFVPLETALAEKADTLAVIFFGMEHTRPYFAIDCNLNVSDTDCHFFTSRPIEYLGWRFALSGQFPISDKFGYGGFAGVSVWTADYWMNLEMPSLGVSLDPMKSSLQGLYFDLGPLVYVRLGPLKVLPYFGVPIGLSRLVVDVEGQTEVGNALYLGLEGGAEVQLQVVNILSLSLGYKRTLLQSSRPRYTLEEGVELQGEFRKMPEELYFGLSLGLVN